MRIRFNGSRSGMPHGKDDDEDQQSKQRERVLQRRHVVLPPGEERSAPGDDNDEEARTDEYGGVDPWSPSKQEPSDDGHDGDHTGQRQYRSDDRAGS